MPKKYNSVEPQFDLIHFEPCKLLSYEKREALKATSNRDHYDYARWLRFIETDVRAGYKVISLPEYKKWLRAFPGWSLGPISKWRKERNGYTGSSFPMNAYLRRKKIA